jgi:hypothetical protein
MKSEHIWSLIGTAIMIGGGLIVAFNSKPLDIPIVIIGTVIGFLGRLLAVYGDEWFG